MTTTKRKTKVKATPEKPTKKPELIAASLRAIEVMYKKDYVCPGLVLSLLRDGQFYASICRYNGVSKTTVFSAKAISWESAVNQVMTKFLEAPDMLETLRRAL